MRPEPLGVNLAVPRAVDCYVQNMMVMEKGACRQLLDWLIEQIDILDQHIDSMAEAAKASGEVVELLDHQLRDAREWLCQQLVDALEARGIEAA